MMKVKFLVVGKTTDKYLLPGIEDYNKRLTRYSNYEYQELPGVRLGKSATADETKRKEEDIILAKLEKSDFLVLMDEKGKEFTSKGFGDFLKKHQMSGTKRIVFLIGGAYGFSDNIYARANSKIALSQMTFTHQMVRLIFTEQLYRAFTITKGEKYHH
jgi:23S rRNA (pseudouridine1915-N3)-methyltransferase